MVGRTRNIEYIAKIKRIYGPDLADFAQEYVDYGVLFDTLEDMVRAAKWSQELSEKRQRK